MYKPVRKPAPRPMMNPRTTKRKKIPRKMTAMRNPKQMTPMMNPRQMRQMVTPRKMKALTSLTVQGLELRSNAKMPVSTPAHVLRPVPIPVPVPVPVQG